MPCDGKNPNCERRRELLAKLKCLVSSMDRKKPCEWDESPHPFVVCCSTDPPSCTPACYVPIKPCKSFDFRASIMYRCECIKRNGLQDRCMMWDCMGRPECMTKLYPICEPGRAALSRLTESDEMNVAIRKFCYMDQARKAALTKYCRLACANACQQQALSCNKSNSQDKLLHPLSNRLSVCSPNKCDNELDRMSQTELTCNNDTFAIQVSIPTPVYSNCYMPQSYYVCYPSSSPTSTYSYLPDCLSCAIC